MLFRSVLTSAVAMGIAALAFSGSVNAQDYKVGSLQIEHPWARATAPGQSMGAGYLVIKNTGKVDDKLVSISTDTAKKAEVHQTTEENNMSKMSAVAGLAIPAGKTVQLASGGYHVMFVQIKTPFKQGTKIPATLTFAKAGQIKIEFKVEPLTFRPDQAEHMDMNTDMSGHKMH